MRALVYRFCAAKDKADYWKILIVVRERKFLRKKVVNLKFQWQERTNRLTRYSKQTGFTTNVSKTQVMCMKITPCESLEYVKDLRYPGSFNTEDSAAPNRHVLQSKTWENSQWPYKTSGNLESEAI